MVNINKTKKLTNMRASGTDDKTALAPATKFSLEEAMEYIKDDEYLEVTPKNLRIRKIFLDENERKKQRKPQNVYSVLCPMSDVLCSSIRHQT